MKKNTLLPSILLILFCSLSYGQEIGYGFKFGLNVSQIDGLSFDLANSAGDVPALGSSTSIDENRIGFAATFFVEIPINEKLSFQPEFGYSAQGNKFDALRYEYLQLPLGLKVNFNNFFIDFGPQVGLKISAFEQSDNFTSFDFSGFGGIGYQFTENIFIEARYTIGFSEVFEDDARIIVALPSGTDVITPNSDNFLANAEGTNSYFTLSIGYRL